VGARASPDGVGAGTSSPPPGRGMASCDTIQTRRGGWRACSLGLSPWAVRPLVVAGGGLGFCEGGPRVVGFLCVAPRPGARWVLVDQGAFWLAYPVGAHPAIRVSTPVGVNLSGSLRAAVAFLDGRGRALQVTQVQGAVAG
jgi:hypothetical protein